MEKKKNVYSEKLRDPRWQKKRLQIMERDKFECQWCNDTESTLNVHHLKYSGEPWEVENEYLITLCESCHEGISNGFYEAGNKLLSALREKAFTPDQILKLTKSIQAGNKRGLPYEPTIDIIRQIFTDDEIYDFAEEKFWYELSQKFKHKLDKVSNG